MDKEKIILVFLGVFITTIFQLLSIYLTKKSDKSLKHTEQLKLLTSELEDLIRHCIANLQVLRSIEIEKGIPSMLHFEKLKVMESSLLFSQDTFVFINSKYTRYINRLKLEIRNINLEIDYVIKYSQNDNFNLEIFKQYVDYLIFKMDVTVTNLPDRLSELMKIEKETLNRILEHKDENEKKSRLIIYE